MKDNSALKFYSDALLIQAALGNDFLSKQANSGMADSLISATKNYVGSKIDEDDKVGSVLNILAPGAITLMLGALGLGWSRYLIGIALNVFHIDFASAISSIHSKLSFILKSGEKPSSEQIDSIVSESFTPLKTDQSDLTSTSFSLRELNLFKLSIEQNKLIKNAGFAASKSKTTSLLALVVKWVVKATLASAGLMLAGDVVNKIMNRPNSFDGTIQKGRETPTEAVSANPISKQIFFKINPSYNNKILNSNNATWVESNNNIKELLLSWMIEVYPEANKYKNEALNLYSFNKIIDEIENYNKDNKSNIVYIPKMFSSKKSVVDIFIDDLAEKADKPV